MVKMRTAIYDDAIALLVQTKQNAPRPTIAPEAQRHWTAINIEYGYRLGAHRKIRRLPEVRNRQRRSR